MKSHSRFSSLAKTTDGPNSAVKPSCNTSKMSTIIGGKLDNGIRHFAKDEIFIDRQHLLGQGAFGKCYLGTVGPCKACIKILKYSSTKYFYSEANILFMLCHPNVSYLLGVCVERVIVLHFHGINFLCIIF